MNNHDIAVGKNIKNLKWFELPEKAEAISDKNGCFTGYFLFEIPVKEYSIGSKTVKELEYAIVYKSPDFETCYIPEYPNTLFHNEAIAKALTLPTESEWR